LLKKRFSSLQKLLGFLQVLRIKEFSGYSILMNLRMFKSSSPAFLLKKRFSSLQKLLGFLQVLRIKEFSGYSILMNLRMFKSSSPAFLLKKRVARRRIFFACIFVFNISSWKVSLTQISSFY